MIQLQQATDWPVPYIARAVIGAGPVEGRCGHCRRLRPIYFFDFVRNWGADCQGVHDMQCDACINEFLRECTDGRSVIQDGRGVE